jgi:hypothetical protein
MIFIQKQRLITIRLTKEEITELCIYLTRCNREGFSGINRYHAHKERERMYQWHLYEVFIKVVTKHSALYHKANLYKTTLKLNEIELHTLSVMFKRVDCTPFMLQLQTRFIKNLVKTY